MKRTFVAALFCMAAGVATAREGELGLGVTIGDPNGITGKYWLDEHSAVEAAAAWSLDEDRFNIHMDYLRHVFDTMKEENIPWAYHYGIGARVLFPNDNHFNNDDDTTLGLRIPLGLDFYPTKAPLELFIEIAPVLEVVPDTNFDMEFGIGARFYFR